VVAAAVEVTVVWPGGGTPLLELPIATTVAAIHEPHGAKHEAWKMIVHVGF
jgi:hypothetical protein